ncbi:MAG TPA: helix-turn-helix domain-containing protein [Candidatus Saccharimonadales bacterium]|nr:helix-turn-helix domain-containing protein [Candidatus Saccharimonadales bacterium]
MISTTVTPKVYTPEQVAEILQLSKNTIYDLISRGEIVAKKIGKVYRIPASSLSFVFTGLDYDLYKAEQEDLTELSRIQEELEKVRVQL